MTMKKGTPLTPERLNAAACAKDRESEPHRGRERGREREREVERERGREREREREREHLGCHSLLRLTRRDEAHRRLHVCYARLGGSAA